MRFFILTILFVFLNSLILSQSHLKIQGLLLNKSDSSAIEFVNISILGTNQGTITNENGEFVFYIPDSIIDGQIIFSSIGYENLLLNINELKKNQIYFLRTKTYSLKSVIVMPIDFTANEIIAFVIKNINKNYPKKKHLLTCFYRETAYNFTSASRLIEAAVEIYNFGINSDFSKDRIKINQFRMSDDKMEYSFFSKMMYKFFGESNMIYETFNSYAISNKNNFKKDFKSKEYSIERVEMLNNTPVVVLKYKDSTHKVKISYGYIYVNMSDFGILKMEHFITVKDKYKTAFKKYLLNGQNYLRKTIRIYNKFDGKYYLKYVEYYRSVHGTSDYNTQNSYNYLSQLLVNDLATTKKYYNKIKKTESSSRDTDLSNIEYKYNPEFWKNYNILLAKPIDNKAKQDLEKEKQLETQFKENAKQ